MQFSVCKLPVNKVKIDLKDLIKQIKNEAVVLEGNAPLDFVLPLYLEMKGVLREIAWRKNETAPAILLYSTVEDPDLVIRSVKVQPPATWTDKELKDLAKKRKLDKKDIIKLDLTKMWLSAKKDTKPLKKFLTSLYGLAPNKERVIMNGKCPIVPAIMVAEWFLIKAESVYFEKIRLK